MEKRDWLLLAIGERIEPIQVQKTLFKFVRESKVPADESYDFVPYNWGPCGFEIYNDLGMLRAEGLVEAVPSGRGWSVYRLTDLGKDKVRQLLEQANPTLVKALSKVREWVTSRDFETLLRDVYKDYPQYATASLLIRQ